MVKRLLRSDEIDLISWMVRDTKESKYIIPSLLTLLVEEMKDGGMGSLRVVSEKNKVYFKDLARVELLDKDGVALWISIHLDTNYDFFELDIWKVDYSPLIRFPSVP
ncbi:hypothetical protein [Pedobacter sp. WC2423]|uniref:DUF6984 family protein n=1 Tax=Pedobacter sp. WC2423 TaxID=3234142 RepID=UPI00346661D7